MKTYFLKFTDEAQAIASLPDYRFEDKWLTSFKQSALDVIGTVYAPTGTMLTDGDFSYPEQAPIEGFYINIATSELPQELRPFSGDNKSGRTFSGAEDMIAEVTMRQARLALLQQGLLATVNTAINALPTAQKDIAKIEWEYSSTIKRNNAIVQQLYTALGLSDAQLDAMFDLASSL